MANLAAVQLDTEGPEAGAPSPPQVFVRTFAIPSGLPWDQARAAQLESRHGAPLPIAELAYRLRRLESWAPGRAGRYAVFYVRRRDFTSPFETTVDVDGEAVRVAFGSTGNQFRRLRGLGLAALVLAGSALLVGSATVTVMGQRAETSQALDRLERETAAKLRLARRLDGERELARALARSQGRSGLPSDVLADISWVARSRTPEARIVAVHWDHGLLAIEARGDAAPVASGSREVMRSERPVRRGVWAWGVSRPIGEPAPVSARLEPGP